MMGVGHGLSGLCAGLGVGNALGLHPSTTALLGAAGAGAAVLCDIDCAGSTASTAFGPLSTLIHTGCVELHYVATAIIDPDNEAPHSPHRGLTHWWPWWVLTGGGVALGAQFSSWVAPIVLIVLLTLGVRAVAIPDRPSTPQNRFRHVRFPYLHDRMMRIAYGLVDITPLRALRILRKHTNQTRKIGDGWFSVRIPVGKITVILAVTALILGAWHYNELPSLGPWLGALVFFGQWLHWIGDSPTEMGVPGLLLNRLVRLPKWIAFKAGGWFEVIALWVPMGCLAVYLIPGLRPHAEVVWVLQWVGLIVGSVFAVITVLTFLTRRLEHRYA